MSALSTAVTGDLVAGINWYSAFDNPEKLKDGSWWIGRSGNLGHVRGGHAICLPRDGVRDLGTWWEFYDQGWEGACVGFAVCRMQTLVNRKVYDAFDVYHAAQRIDEWPGEDYEGTSMRAGLEVMRTMGAPLKNTDEFKLAAGISAYRWLSSVHEARAVLASPRYDEREAVRILNSWGREWPHYVWMPYTVLERLLHEDGELAVATDR